MSRPNTSRSLLSRLGALFKSSKSETDTFSAEHIAARVKLPFTNLQIPELSICWKNNLFLQHLYDLPRGALSGPVQEDKAQAHALFSKLINKVIDTECVIDLRDIYGFSESLPHLATTPDLESFAAHPECRHIRIISYRDFEKTITQAVPSFLSDQPLNLRQASWLGEQLFWADEQSACEFACAVVYARRRGLDLPKRTYISRYSLNTSVLHTIQKNYHMLIMPEQTWADAEFMAILLGSRSPYARLTLAKSPTAVEVLLLSKRNPLSDTLGRGLRRAGAYDACDTLMQLASMQK